MAVIDDLYSDNLSLIRCNFLNGIFLYRSRMWLDGIIGDLVYPKDVKFKEYGRAWLALCAEHGLRAITTFSDNYDAQL